MRSFSFLVSSKILQIQLNKIKLQNGFIIWSKLIKKLSKFHWTGEKALIINCSRYFLESFNHYFIFEIIFQIKFNDNNKSKNRVNFLCVWVFIVMHITNLIFVKKTNIFFASYQFNTLGLIPRCTIINYLS